MSEQMYLLTSALCAGLGLGFTFNKSKKVSLILLIAGIVFFILAVRR